MNTIKAFIHENPVRVAAFVSSAVALIVTAVSPDVDHQLVIAFVLSALGLGEYAQRIENEKTDEALFTDPKDVL